MDAYFDDDSPIRRLHADRVVALSGPRALLMQAAHPLVAAALVPGSGTVAGSHDRLARTGEAMRTVVFGSRAEADALARR
ncbi:MAG TPA: oxygenase MpaB family protein, partial [Thermoleophilaceae bacterium]|nr:oxygenase MpaB family protein [Thermoleophilaceae bacterium]